MDLLYAIRDLGVTDPADNSAAAASVRADLAQAIDEAIADPRPVTSQRPHRRRGLLAGAGVAVLVAAGATAVVIATAGGSRPAPARSVRITGPHAPVPGDLQNSAYIIRRVRARLIAADRRRGVVLSTIDRTGSPTYRTVTYFDPRTQIFYQNDRAYDRHGREMFANVDADIPIRNYMHFRTFTIDYDNHTWGKGESVANEPFQTGPIHRKYPLSPGALSPPSAVTRALSSHIATRAGTGTLDGTPALVLKGQAGVIHFTLYVDSRTYQPLRETQREQGRFHLNSITNVLPATTANIAWAKNLPKIPTSYTRDN